MCFVSGGEPFFHFGDLLSVFLPEITLLNEFYSFKRNRRGFACVLLLKRRTVGIMRDELKKPGYSEEIGSLVRARRLALGMTMKQVSVAARVSVASLHGLEHGKLSIQLDSFLRILSVLDFSAVNVLRISHGDPSPEEWTEFQRLLREHARTDLPGLIQSIAGAVRDKPGKGLRAKRR